MNTVKIKNIEIGSGIPKICIPITSSTEAEILKEAEAIELKYTDIVEWRADFYEDVFEIEKTINLISKLRSILKDIPLLFTFRTKKEGGEKELSPALYAKLNTAVAESKCVDIIDIEVFSSILDIQDFILELQKLDIRVIASYHNFVQTPLREDIISMLLKMQSLGADIAKLAAMPQSKQDVLTLLSATEEMVSKHALIPIVAISMSNLGMVSRISGEIFGSSITFGIAKKASAPGQINSAELHSVLEIIHNSLSMDNNQNCK